LDDCRLAHVYHLLNHVQFAQEIVADFGFARSVHQSLVRRGPGHTPVSVAALAQQLPDGDWQEVTWHEGSNTFLSSRFAAIRVRAAHRDHWRASWREEESLLIEWPEQEAEPITYWLCTLPADSSLEHLVSVAKMRWRIERDYQELKQEFGLSHFEGRGWRGFHHHATLCIAAYGFLMTQRLKHGGSKKNSARPTAPPLPQGYSPRGSWTRAAARARFHPDCALPYRTNPLKATGKMPLLRSDQCYLLTQ
jgi:SRSO17 transposase